MDFTNFSRKADQNLESRLVLASHKGRNEIQSVAAAEALCIMLFIAFVLKQTKFVVPFASNLYFSLLLLLYFSVP